MYEFITFDDFNITIYFHSLLWTLCTHVVPIENVYRMIDVFLLFNLEVFIKIFYLILIENQDVIMNAKRCNLMDLIRN